MAGGERPLRLLRGWRPTHLSNPFHMSLQPLRLHALPTSSVSRVVFSLLPHLRAPRAPPRPTPTAAFRLNSHAGTLPSRLGLISAGLCLLLACERRAPCGAPAPPLRWNGSAASWATHDMRPSSQPCKITISGLNRGVCARRGQLRALFWPRSVLSASRAPPGPRLAFREPADTCNSPRSTASRAALAGRHGKRRRRRRCRHAAVRRHSVRPGRQGGYPRHGGAGKRCL